MKHKHSLDILSAEFINKMPILVIGLDSSGSVIYWNKMARSITGYTKKEASKEAKTLFTDLFVSDLSLTKQITNEESSIMTKKGDVRNIVWNSYIIPSKEADADKVLILTGIDVTPKRQLETTLKIKNKYIEVTNAKLEKYASVDPLTGLMNYRYFMRKFHDHFYQAARSNKPLGLLLIDISYFQSINFIHGVSKGNKILSKVAVLLKRYANKKYITARYSGTEFAILMPGADTKTAFSEAAKLFSVLSDHNFGVSRSPINVSLYMALGGVPHCEDAVTPENLIDRITRKLKEAKASGDNSILICSPREQRVKKSDEVAIPGLSKAGYKYTVEFVNALAKTVKTKDCYTQEHSSIMSNYAVYIADYLGLSSQDIQNIKFGALLHDLGKIGIDKMILLKPGGLTSYEFELIKQHPMIGAEIIRNVHPLKEVVPMVLYHHEKYDGSGYLAGLRGDEIPLGARIVSISDVFQALTSDRPYRKALSEKAACSIIKNYSGSSFDPKVVKAFFEVYKSVK